jgi:hypothetical protein
MKQAAQSNHQPSRRSFEPLLAKAGLPSTDSMTFVTVRALLLGQVSIQIVSGASVIASNHPGSHSHVTPTMQRQREAMDVICQAK